jgi:N-acetyl-anhydromuramyl-L-alanine amidase AmpD
MVIINKPTTNKYSRDGNIPDMICCHQTSGTKASSALNWFLDKLSFTSANFLVDQDGTIYQCVPINYGAWCNGNKIKLSEINESNHYTKSLNPIIRSRKINANKYTVSIEFVHKGLGDITDKQKESGLWLMKYIIAEIKRIYNYDFIIDRQHIIGHYEISPVKKAGCAGKLFPYDYFINGLKGNEPVKIPVKVNNIIEIGDKVEYAGAIFTNSLGECKSCKGYRTGTGIVNDINDNKAGYLIDGQDKGWFKKESLKEIQK